MPLAAAINCEVHRGGARLLQRLSEIDLFLMCHLLTSIKSVELVGDSLLEE
jgi:hypothetical protein